MRSITIIFVLLTASVVQAQALAVRTTGTICTQTGCTQFTGTGACAYIGNIEDRSVYITAAHNLTDAKTLHVGYGGKWWSAKVIHKEYQGSIDYAIIETDNINAPKCFSLAEQQPQDGVNAVAYGYSNGIYNLRGLRANIRVTRSGRFFSKVVAKGDSGGPILVNGQVVGIIKGHDTRNTIYTDSTLIRRRVVSIYGKLPCCNCLPPVVGPEPPNSLPVVPVPDNGDQIAGLEVEIGKLRAEIDRLNKTKIPVWIMGADGKPVAKQTYPLGDPIKLRFKAVKQSEAK